ncbi:MAG: PA2778 family cysteine peptidase [Desulfobacterales bacterium]|jgi:tetratricopeptide (TPR) repeat protein
MAVWGWVFGLFVLSGCATTSTHKWRQAAESIPPHHKLNAVPFYPQKAYQCGPASLAMVLSWSGLQISPDELTPQVYTPSLKGSLQPAMIAATRRQGKVAYPINGAQALLSEIAAGHPVIVLQNLGLSWIPVWHYAVVIGYDVDAEVVILHSGVTSRKKTSFRTFENTWARSEHWGLLVLPPDRLPATVREQSWIAAVVGLEKARQWPAAMRGYQSALHRWPQSFSAHIGLGNSCYAMGDLASAAAVLRKATDRFPQEGVAFNNLAQVLWEQGKKKEAINAARRAVKLGGPHAEQFKKTLDEIQSGEP